MSVIRKIISTNKAPKPVAPYNQAVLLDKTLYVSGVLGLNKDTMKLVDGGAGAEARQALQSLGHILEEAGSSFEKVAKTTIFLNNIDDFGAVNDVYKDFFTKNHPARSTFQVGKLPMGAKVEIEVIAAVGDVTQIPSKI
ncbi:rutC family protein UK114 [Tribolium castaneum]|uniref:Ribonuclease UK114-like Protein n=1 Tax=Tribolium castaneum TaxID=7070 RepID=D6WVK4_TRICA|nr:PREDICTED: ribonuclease UK114 [Tribolium castaneum]EFA08585.1 Ribonuclease UK114-like Protein [Tribolium castaneum]|eukprot:XP_972764.1 PREDICTED: ribonuclease UK114 [Tribolium castaneum]